MFKFIKALFLVFFLDQVLSRRHYRDEIERIINKKYNPNERPNYEIEEPVIVYISINIVDMGAEKNVFHLDIYLRQAWIDERLRFNTSMRTVDVHKYFEKFWVPDVVFLNEKSASSHDVTVPNLYLKASPDGQLIYSRKYSVRYRCPMDLTRFPLDTQTCSADIALYGSDRKQVRLEWGTNLTAQPTGGCDNGAVAVTGGSMEVNEFMATNISCARCSNSMSGIDVDCLSIIFTLSRMRGYYIINAYIPLAIIVVMSWTSFWVSLDSIPARTSVAFLTILAVHTKSSGLHRSNMPTVSYAMALDVYVVLCHVFCFVALLEFVLAAQLLRAKDAAWKPIPLGNSGEDSEGRGASACEHRVAKINAGELLDNTFRIVYPIAFSLANLVYWLVYL